MLSYAVGGNTRLEVGVIDRSGEGTDRGSFITVRFDGDGQVTWAVRVGDERVVCGPCP